MATAFAYDPEKQTLTEIDSLSTLPSDFKENNSTAEIQIHPSGKFLYVSNRGHNSIAIFGIDPSTGKLTALGHQSTLGKTPGNFCIDLSGKYLLAENQDSDSIVPLLIDQQSGMLIPTRANIALPKPVCIRFVPIDPERGTSVP